MPDVKNLPYLIKLFDIDSFVGSDKVLKKLHEFGIHQLEEELAKLSNPPDENRLEELRTALMAYQFREYCRNCY